MSLTLIIGNKNLSTWSLRPWLLLKQAGIDFMEKKILLDLPESRAQLKAASPSGLVPCLIDDSNGDRWEIWDSLAIAEYLNEKFPQKLLWPDDIKARARARSYANEMHSGFSALRQVWPMDVVREDLAVNCAPDVKQNVTRINKLWEDARHDFGEKAKGEAAGPFLFGRFSIADAMFAPVVFRFKTYGPVALSSRAQTYYEAMLAQPMMQQWRIEAHAEVEN